MSSTTTPVGWLDDHRAGLLAKLDDPVVGDRDPVEEIRDLLVRYVVCYDAGDVDGVLDVFAPDATYTTLLGTFRGHDELRSNYDALLDRFRASSHLMTNQTIRLTGPDTAQAWSYLHAIVELKNGTAYALTASYQDRVERRSDRWRIVERTVRDGVSYAITAIRADERLAQRLPGER